MDRFNAHVCLAGHVLNLYLYLSLLNITCAGWRNDDNIDSHAIMVAYTFEQQIGL